MHNFIPQVHPTKYDEYKEYLSSGRRRKRIRTIGFPVVATTSTEQQRVERLIMDYIIDSMKPLSTVKDESFQKLVTGMDVLIFYTKLNQNITKLHHDSEVIYLKV